jgi:site-specific DNA recombinase
MKATSAETLRAGCYYRVSTAEQKKKMGPDMQRTRCRALCEARGWEVAAEYEDLGLTGRNMDRPGLQALLRAAADGEIGVVAVYRLDRLARKSRHLQEIWEDGLAGHGVELASTTESIDTSNPMGRAMMGMVGVMAQLESEMIQERTSDGRREKAMQGGFGQAVRSYGFRWDKGDKEAGRPKRPVIVEHEAAVVRDIFDMAAAGYSVQNICKRLNAQGMTRRGGRGRGGQAVAPGQWWNPDAQEIIQNPAYMGRFVTWRDPETGEETLADPKLCLKAIVEPAVWQAAQAVTQAYRRRGRRTVRREFLLSGLCVCAECGATLTIRQPDERNRYYACNSAARHKCSTKHVPAADLDAEIWGQVKAWATNPKLLRRCARTTKADLLPRWKERVAEVGVEMKRWQARVRRAKDLLEDPAASAYTLDDFTDTKRQHDEAMPALAAEAEQLEAQITQAEASEQSIDWTARTLAAAGDLDALDLAGKRRLLTALAVKVTVRTHADERNKLSDWTAELESFAAAVTGLAVTEALS